MFHLKIFHWLQSEEAIQFLTPRRTWFGIVLKIKVAAKLSWKIIRVEKKSLLNFVIFFPPALLHCIQKLIIRGNGENYPWTPPATPFRHSKTLEEDYIERNCTWCSKVSFFCYVCPFNFCPEIDLEVRPRYCFFFIPPKVSSPSMTIMSD